MPGDGRDAVLRISEKKYFSVEAFKMRIRFNEKILLLIILNLLIYSYCFAQIDSTKLIIQGKIDELWTSGKLQIGYSFRPACCRSL